MKHIHFVNGEFVFEAFAYPDRVNVLEAWKALDEDHAINLARANEATYGGTLVLTMPDPPDGFTGCIRQAQDPANNRLVPIPVGLL